MTTRKHTKTKTVIPSPRLPASNSKSQLNCRRASSGPPTDRLFLIISTEQQDFLYRPLDKLVLYEPLQLIILYKPLVLLVL